jgi:hypothetical protein
MRRLLIVIAVLILSIPGALAEGIRFRPVDVVIDTGSRPLAAYQFELAHDREVVKLVGIEGGEGLFRPAPYYDPRGLELGRVVIAAFTTNAHPPAGRVRVARIHVAYEGEAEPVLDGSLVLAATLEGVPIDASLELVFSTGGE